MARAQSLRFRRGSAGSCVVFEGPHNLKMQSGGKARSPENMQVCGPNIVSSQLWVVERRGSFRWTAVKSSVVSRGPSDPVCVPLCLCISLSHTLSWCTHTATKTKEWHLTFRARGRTATQLPQVRGVLSDCAFFGTGNLECNLRCSLI